jgi:hypothetical protein
MIRACFKLRAEIFTWMTAKYSINHCISRLFMTRIREKIIFVPIGTFFCIIYTHLVVCAARCWLWFTTYDFAVLKMFFFGWWIQPALQKKIHNLYVVWYKKKFLQWYLAHHNMYNVSWFISYIKSYIDHIKLWCLQLTSSIRRWFF